MLLSYFYDNCFFLGHVGITGETALVDDVIFFYMKQHITATCKAFDTYRHSILFDKLILIPAYTFFNPHLVGRTQCSCLRFQIKPLNLDTGVPHESMFGTLRFGHGHAWTVNS